MMLKYTFGGEEVEFETHRQGYGGPRYLAINVKCHDYDRIPLSPEAKAQLATLMKADPRADDRLHNRVYERTEEAWWDWAQALAKELDLGKVYATGRSGGWLVLQDFPEANIDDLQEHYNETCKHCHQDCAHHARNGKCLFGPTQFEPYYDGPRNRFENLKFFIAEVKASLVRVAEDYHENYLAALEVALDEHCYQQEEGGCSPHS